MTTSIIHPSVNCAGEVTGYVTTNAGPGVEVKVIEIWGVGTYAPGARVKVGANVFIGGVRHDADAVEVRVPTAAECQATTTTSTTVPETTTTSAPIVEPSVPQVTAPATTVGQGIGSVPGPLETSTTTAADTTEVTLIPPVSITSVGVTLPRTGASTTGDFGAAGGAFLGLGLLLVVVGKWRTRKV